MNCPACNQPHSTHSVQDGDKIKCQRCGQVFVVFVEFVPQYTTRLLMRPAASHYDAETFRSDWGPWPEQSPQPDRD